ncbi:MAG: sigma-70 family RNA polymerase sigma factor [Phycisphaerales bacterium]|jgi:RNA polymerase sigma-70 factor, ECF subfamily|nr:sigma-70 family RNA polymerase sigma factor [Phycisphaerales bacterium]MBT7171669.1 sigma-70 family RNA polymerase sigma factor [Phycisphaerales bacterium]
MASEATLIHRSREGDLAAFTDLVTRYQDRVYNAIRRMGLRHAEAEELTQEAFMRAFANIHGFRGDSGFYTWVFRIGLNLTRSSLRRKKLAHFAPLELQSSLDGDMTVERDESAALSARRVAPPEAELESRETTHAIQHALTQLDEELRSVAILRDIENLDYNEIASILACPVGTVKSRLHRARTKLRGLLAALIES